MRDLNSAIDLFVIVPSAIELINCWAECAKFVRLGKSLSIAFAASVRERLILPLCGSEPALDAVFGAFLRGGGEALVVGDYLL